MNGKDGTSTTTTTSTTTSNNNDNDNDNNNIKWQQGRYAQIYTAGHGGTLKSSIFSSLIDTKKGPKL